MQFLINFTIFAKKLQKISLKGKNDAAPGIAWGIVPLVEDPPWREGGARRVVDAPRRAGDVIANIIRDINN